MGRFALFVCMGGNGMNDGHVLLAKYTSKRRFGDADSDVSDDDDLADLGTLISARTIIMQQNGQRTGSKGVNDDQKYRQQMVASKKQSQLAEYSTMFPGRVPLTTIFLHNRQQQ
ncbi:hypothetical protein BCR42DRAFT_390163 [Absidia repens]|uniref:Uncharacterized protein n=1 Tax=Absidia repens TaxID=90262 RepID=A0A1X2IN95_9FUNG|nr:hypothetical protein BCR42DRAFT_390163 [Absidia repens]